MVKLLTIDAAVEECERPALISARDQLREAFVANGIGLDADMRFHGAPSQVPANASVVVLSLLRAALSDDPLTAVEARWRAVLEEFTKHAAPVFLCTVFRHVPDVRNGAAGAPAQRRLERIRRLNLMAAELSHDTGVFVIDLDRALAHLGARTLNTDLTLKRRRGPFVAGHSIAAALLSVGLDDWAPAEVLEQARKTHGGMKDVLVRLRQRFKRTRGNLDGNGIAATITLNAPDPGV